MQYKRKWSVKHSQLIPDFTVSRQQVHHGFEDKAYWWREGDLFGKGFSWMDSKESHDSPAASPHRPVFGSRPSPCAMSEGMGEQGSSVFLHDQ